MRALVSLLPGGPETLHWLDLPEPLPGPGEVRVSVRAVGLNATDLLMMRDLYQDKVARPYSPGGEVAGVVEALGDGVRDLAVGDRVVAITGSGGLREQIVLPAAGLIGIPSEVSFEEASVLPIAYASALHALQDRAHLTSGQRVLVTGAGAGIGLATVQIATQLGAEVVAACSTDEKVEAALAGGAVRGLAYSGTGDDAPDRRELRRLFAEAVGEGGADVVVDPVSGPYADPAARALGLEGRYVLVGFAAGVGPLPNNVVLVKQAKVIGSALGEYLKVRPERLGTLMAQLLDWCVAGTLRPSITSVVPLDQAADGLDMLDRRAITGKVVVQVGK
ncbi:NADPH:quinone oxidoreductase family protein [Rhodococcus sp. IEGM 1307]|uniref:NADPH:quinone oxidoreductase family protein n=1 Tax=Rhodococcus sp. IEGM 1307 TaxID=3047091 RepID=UPI0024B7EA4C|nr:NADPH:quinone oxidoreductase family protein [Rhodococcus sp. IEGM 1307]MDI9977401.1 NADPH:quinone oxidoreductase family protein [Rhodococcus sp. IEGM 1307]